jgi:hypothetical protein
MGSLLSIVRHAALSDEHFLCGVIQLSPADVSRATDLGSRTVRRGTPELS